MKKVFFLFVVVTAMLISTNSFAQETVKLGHLNFEELVSAMPEKDSADLKLQQYANDLQETMEIMQVEYNNKLNDYQQVMNTLTNAMRQNREQELMDLQRRLQEFQANAQQEYQKIQVDLFQPVSKKAEEAISAVATENGYTYVFYDNALLFYSANSDDLTAKVKAKLGIK